MTDTLNINELKEILANFAKIREWERFHSPKNLSMAKSTIVHFVLGPLLGFSSIIASRLKVAEQ